MNKEQLEDLQWRINSYETHIQSVVVQSPLFSPCSDDGAAGGKEKVKEIQQHMMREFRTFVDETGLMRWTMFLIKDSAPVRESLKGCAAWMEFCTWFENTSHAIATEISDHSKSYAKKLLSTQVEKSLHAISDTWPKDSVINMHIISPTGEPEKCQTLTLFVVI